MAYAGSLQRVDFGEEDHETKGFYVLDLDPQAHLGHRINKLELRPVQTRSFVTVSQTIEKDDVDPTRTVLRSIKRHHIQDAIVRVQVTIPAALAPALRERDIRRALEEAGAHTIASFSRQIEREQRTRLGEIKLASQSPTQLLDLYFQTCEIPKDRVGKLTTYAKRLMQSYEEDRD